MAAGSGRETGGLTLRSDYLGDRDAFLALAGLLEDTFGIDISILDRFGGPDPTSMPFGLFDDAGRCVANFSAFSMPLIVDGERVRAVGYQSGAVRPEYRGRGLYRELMERAFAWSEEEGFEAGILLADKPGLYRRYGFETVPQHAFHGPMPTGRGPRTARALSLEVADDLALVMRLLETHTGISGRFATRGQGRALLLNACFDPDIRLSYIPASDAVVAWRLDAATLQILDIVADSVPPLAEVVSALSVDAADLQVLCPTDRLDWQGTAEIYRGACDLMIRPMSRTARSSEKFMLSPAYEF